MFDLFKGTKIQSINNNKYIRLRSAILPMKEQNFFSINIDLFFNSENWKLKSLKQMTIKNIWGNNLTYRIKFWYKINEEDEPKMYEFDFNQSLFSKHDQKNTTTITIF
jgi:hypothetical protein